MIPLPFHRINRIIYKSRFKFKITVIYQELTRAVGYPSCRETDLVAQPQRAHATPLLRWLTAGPNPRVTPPGHPRCSKQEPTQVSLHGHLKTGSIPQVLQTASEQRAISKRSSSVLALQSVICAHIALLGIPHARNEEPTQAVGPIAMDCNPQDR